MTAFAAWCSQAEKPAHPYRYSVLDVPVSLSKGTVTSPTFSTRTHWYWILVQVEKPFSFERMNCMMSTQSGDGLRNCVSTDPILDAKWQVRDGDRIVATGVSEPTGAGKFTKENIFKIIGSFLALKDHAYTLTVFFRKDGSQLNVANPHLIVVAQGEE
jgi:hypothetical protein